MTAASPLPLGEDSIFGERLNGLGCRELLPRLGQLRVGLAQPVGQHLHEAPQQLHREDRLALHQAHQVAAADHHGAGGLDGPHGGGARGVVDEPHLAEVTAGAQLGDLDAVLLDRHPAADDHEQLFTRLALGDDLAARGEGAGAGRGEHRRLLLVGEVPEEGDLLERLHPALGFGDLFGGRRGVAGAADHHGGDVVLAAALVGQGHEALGQLAQRRRSHHRGDLVVVEVAVQPVGAEHEDVARHGVDDQRVDLHRFLDADRAGDHVAVLAGGRLFLGDGAGLELGGDQGVIFGQPVALAVAHQVHPAVAHVADHALAAADGEADEGGAHAALGGVGGGRL